MNAVLLEPHPDDCALFAAFLALTHKPVIWTVYDKGIDRATEANHAARMLGCDHRQMLNGPDELPSLLPMFDLVIAPAHHDGGHGDHNTVAALAAQHPNVIFYTSYVNGGDRVHGPNQVPYQTAWIPLKWRALGCFTSQIANPLTAQHFLRDAREWTT